MEKMLKKEQFSDKIACVVCGMTTTFLEEQKFMEFDRIYAPSLKELFIKQLQNRILSGDLPVGTKLPSERELCQQMHVSRAVVNAGITELSRMGFLTVEPRQGTYVADYRRNGNLDTLVAIMNYNKEALGRDEIRSILELRLALEKIAVASAITHGSEEQFAELGRYVLELKNAKSAQQAAKAAFAFHHGMTLVGTNSILPLIYSSFEMPCHALWVRFCRKFGVASLYQNVKTLYDYMLAKDLAKADAWIETYLRDSIDGTKEIYEA